MGEVEPFDQFLKRVEAARPEDFADALEEGAKRAGLSHEQARQEFARMKAHVLSAYKDVHPVGSYLDAGGQPIDCIPVEQQPAARAAARPGHAPPTPPTPRSIGRGAGKPAAAAAPLCPEGAIPMVRVTLERITPFGTLDGFFQKYPPPK